MDTLVVRYEEPAPADPRAPLFLRLSGISAFTHLNLAEWPARFAKAAGGSPAASLHVDSVEPRGPPGHGNDVLVVTRMAPLEEAEPQTPRATGRRPNGRGLWGATALLVLLLLLAVALGGVLATSAAARTAIATALMAWNGAPPPEEAAPPTSR